MSLLQQAVVLSGAAVLLIAVRRASIAGRLSFGFAVMWSLIAALAAIGGALIPFVDRIGDRIGLLPAAVLAAGASIVLAAIAYSLSLRVSELEAVQQDLAEHAALRFVEPALQPAEAGATLAVVPAFNEARSVGSVVTALIDVGLPVLVVDDGSTDRTAAVAREAGASVVSLPVNLGVGGALRAGFRHALELGFSQVVQCDADGQHPVESVMILLHDQAADPVDMLIGSRFLTSDRRTGRSPTRAAAMWVLSSLASRASRATITDPTSGLRAIRGPLLGEVARHIPRHYLGDTFEVNIAALRAGYTIRESPVEMRPRAFGASSADPLSAARLTLRALLVFGLRAHTPMIGPAEH